MKSGRPQRLLSPQRADVLVLLSKLRLLSPRLVTLKVKRIVSSLLPVQESMWKKGRRSPEVPKGLELQSLRSSSLSTARTLLRRNLDQLKEDLGVRNLRVPQLSLVRRRSFLSLNVSLVMVLNRQMSLDLV
ncbi:hypothetical protein EUTSA_v10002335mg [Eutrema salsugineum]|uniref:Uncharacterized protein n=1 Tax=Eutrema salsugineum TaxID=72664 RepID=V4NTL0_EUTSA|nr:hypothetical protein EUTSA_v10002335mg [Eutrema salsugineum]